MNLSCRGLGAAFACVLLLTTAAPVHAATGIPVTETVSTTDRSDLQLIDAVRALVPAAMRETGEPGVSIALARHGRIIWRAGFGWADLEARAKMTPDNAFKAGSMSKSYVATAIMQLVEQGVISLDDRADKYLPFKVENPLGDRPVTIRDLMLHQSGLSIGDDGESQSTPPRPLEVALAEAYARPHLRPYEASKVPTWGAKVGSQWQYSNIGAATLGLIVQRANPEHLSFPDYVQTHIMDPLGMTGSQFPADQARLRPDVAARLSHGYSRIGAVYLPTPKVVIEGYPAGNAVIVPSDHIRLLMAYMNGGELDGHRILKADTVREMITPQRDTPAPTIKQGLIWRIWDSGKPTEIFEHSGLYMYGWTNSAFAFKKLDTEAVVSVNDWPLPGTPSVRDLVQKFIGDWLVLDARMGSAPPPGDWKWKASYVMGLVFTEAYNGALGVRDRLSREQLETLADHAIFDPDGPAAELGWDKAGFIAGVEDLRQVHMTDQGMAGFRDSGKMRVSPEEALILFHALGGAGADFPFAKAAPAAGK